MNIFCDSSGIVFHVDPDRIFQGSVGVNVVRFIGQFPSSAQVLMSYKLPNGVLTTPKRLSLVAQMEEVQAPNGGKFSVWEGRIGASPRYENGEVVKDVQGNVVYDLDYTITEHYGTAQLQFFVYGATQALNVGGVITPAFGGQLATATVDFTIQVGNPYIPIEFNTDDSQALLNEILTVLAGIEQAYQNIDGAGIAALQEQVSENTENIKTIGDNLSSTQTQVDENTSDIAGLRSDIQNEAHFRGYLQTNAEVQALQGTPNDYAYSAESGTVWIYQNGAWVNSGKPVPDQITPASNATPLMDGTPSAGTENAYARGDHRHPTDTTRLATSEKGAANGVATLDGSGKVPKSQLPDDIGSGGGSSEGGGLTEEQVKNIITEQTAALQPKTDESLETTSKEIVGAINELNAEKVTPSSGLTVDKNGNFTTTAASEPQIDNLTDRYRIIAPINLLYAVFTALKKLPNNTTSYTYTADELSAIRAYLGIDLTIAEVVLEITIDGTGVYFPVKIPEFQTQNPFAYAGATSVDGTYVVIGYSEAIGYIVFNTSDNTTTTGSGSV